ncbi:MAG: ABC transporter ATP-binding protein [Bdellovibrio sp.]
MTTDRKENRKENRKAQENSFQSLKRLLSYSSRYKRQYWLGSLYSFLNKFFDVAPEILIGIAIDVVVSQKASFIAKLGYESPQEQLFFLAGLTLVIWVCESLFEYLLLITWRGLAQSIQHELRQAGYAHLQRLDMGYFENQTSGQLVSILNDDVNQLERFLNGGANSIIQLVSTVVLVGGVFFAISPLIAVVSFVPVPIILWGAFYFQRKAAPLYRVVREKAGALSSRLSNNITGIATIQSFTMEEREAKTLEQDSQDYLTANASAIRISSAFIPLIRMAILFGFLCTFLFGGMMVLRGELNVGMYGVLVFLTQRLLWPMTGFAETVDLFERAMASTNRVLNIIETPLSIVDKPGALARAPFNQPLKFDQINFSYQGRETTIQDFSYEIPFGRTVALVGPTGSGKSTLVKLLLRFYEVGSGTISIGGVDIQDIALKSLRQGIGYVGQDVFLFSGTIADNIAYGLNRKLSREAVMEAARRAHAHEFILKLPDGYDTVIGERGQKLSGGQRQRISIARAILKDPPILILDEATSAVDNETESLIQKSLEEVRKGRTMIVIAHRLSTIVGADEILVLDQGLLKEKGTHEELMTKNGLYAQLWNLQTIDGRQAFA